MTGQNEQQFVFIGGEANVSYADLTPEERMMFLREQTNFFTLESGDIVKRPGLLLISTGWFDLQSCDTIKPCLRSGQYIYLFEASGTANNSDLAVRICDKGLRIPTALPTRSIWSTQKGMPGKISTVKSNDAAIDKYDILSCRSGYPNGGGTAVRKFIGWKIAGNNKAITAHKRRYITFKGAPVTQDTKLDINYDMHNKTGDWSSKTSFVHGRRFFCVPNDSADKIVGTASVRPEFMMGVTPARYSEDVLEPGTNSELCEAFGAVVHRDDNFGYTQAGNLPFYDKIMDGENIEWAISDSNVYLGTDSSVGILEGSEMAVIPTQMNYYRKLADVPARIDQVVRTGDRIFFMSRSGDAIYTFVMADGQKAYSVNEASIHFNHMLNPHPTDGTAKIISLAIPRPMVFVLNKIGDKEITVCTVIRGQLSASRLRYNDEIQDIESDGDSIIILFRRTINSVTKYILGKQEITTESRFYGRKAPRYNWLDFQTLLSDENTYDHLHDYLSDPKSLVGLAFEAVTGAPVNVLYRPYLSAGVIYIEGPGPTDSVHIGLSYDSIVETMPLYKYIGYKSRVVFASITFMNTPSATIQGKNVEYELTLGENSFDNGFDYGNYTEKLHVIGDYDDEKTIRIGSNLPYPCLISRLGIAVRIAEVK